MATPTGAATSATSQNTDPTVDQPQNRDPNAPRARQLSPREQLIEGIAEKQTLSRREDQRNYEAEKAALERGEEPAAATAEPAATAAEPAATSSEPAVSMDEHIVIQNGKPMMKLKVDGKEKLMPLEAARAQLQKHQAADARLAAASEAQRRNEAREIALREQDTQLRRREAAVAARESTRSQPAPAASPAAPAVDDQALASEAKGIVQSLLTEPADVAAGKLAATLKRVRASAPAPAAQPTIDPKVVVKEATAAAVEQIRFGNAMAAGFNAFTDQYSDIAADPTLMQLADGKTTEIVKEHPEWTPSQVMLEAGRQTREWMSSLGITAVKTTQSPTNAPATKTPTTTDRETAKRNLRPMPVARTAAPAAAPAEPTRDDPRAALAEMRKSRGQPV